MKRLRFIYFILLILIIILGLASRHFIHIFPSIFGKYPGDTLWAMMVFLIWRIIFFYSSTTSIMLYSLFTCYLIELGQLYQADWIYSIRKNFIGHLFLGSTFSWIDLVAYTIGIGIMGLGESVFYRGKK